MSARLGADVDVDEEGDSDSMAFMMNQLFLFRVSGFLVKGVDSEGLREMVEGVCGGLGLVKERYQPDRLFPREFMGA
jgi:hypothetical protein